ncbi:hypothetical protein ZWY2020_013233 [Hordeum vulgare]|nr:hypothetical protein ZWY2020_013233 [Hordeum vulgare]
MPDAGSGVEEAGDWRLVVSRKGPRRSAQDVDAFKSASIPRWLLGRCCRCLLCRHRAESCCAPPPLPRPAAALAALQAPPWTGRGWEDPDLHTLLQPPASPVGMPRMGDASMRPDVVPATPEMHDEAAILSSNSVVAWLESARKDISCRQVAAELATALGARTADVEKIKQAGPCTTIPAAKAAEKLLCCSLGIMRDGEDVTEATLADFTAKFKDQLAPEVILAMRAFLHLNDQAVNNVEEALIDHSGEATMEITQDDIQAQLNLGSQ